MVSFNDAVDAALKSEYEMTFDGYELVQLFKTLNGSPEVHLRTIAREMSDKFFARVVSLNILPFDDIEDEN